MIRHQYRTFKLQPVRHLSQNKKSRFTAQIKKVEENQPALEIKFVIQNQVSGSLFHHST